MIKPIIQQSIIFIVVSTIIALSVNAINPNGITLLAKDLPQLAKIDITTTEVSEPIIATLSLEQAKSFYDSGIPFIDARHDEYYHEGHIKGAIPSDNYMEMIFTLDSLLGKKTAPIVTYCDGDDCGSSEELAYDLQSSGYTKIYIFVGGWTEWTNANYPVSK